MEWLLTSSQRAFLRSRASTMPVDVIVGKAGPSQAVLAHLRVQLARRELVKLRLPAAPGGRQGRQAAAERLARPLGAAIVEVLGRVVVLYRPNERLPAGKRITFSED